MNGRSEEENNLELFVSFQYCTAFIVRRWSLMYVNYISLYSLFIVDKNIIHYHVSSVSELTCESNWIEEISYRLTRRNFLSHLSRHAVKNKRLRKKNWDLNSTATFWVRHASIFWRDFELVRLKPLEPMQIQTNFRYFPIMTFDTLALPRSFPIIIATALKIEMLSILHNMDMAGGVRYWLTKSLSVCR